MKRIVLLMVTAIMALTLAACGKSEAAQNVDDMIAALEIIDENSGTSIEEAETAYNGLTDKDRAALDHYAQLEEARSAFDELMAYQAVDAINWIGTVTENSWNDIENARQIYDALTEAQQQLVSNYSSLTAAEKEYVDIQVAPVERLIAEVMAFDMSADALPDGFIDALESANEAYEELDDALKSQVDNYSGLVSAATYLSDYRVTHLISYIDENLAEVNFDSGVSLTVANGVYDMMSDEEKARITNYDVLKAAQEKFEALSPIRLNSYTLGKNTLGQPTIKISATNVTNSVIKEYTMYVFAYDSDGVPVKVNNLSARDGFSTGLRDSDALKAGATTKSNAYWQLYGDYSEMKQIVVILKSVEFYDGTTWQNPQYSTLYDKYNEKILSPDDENVLPRA